MHSHYLQIKAHNAMHLLPRLLMAFTRRRIEVREMHLVNDGQYFIQMTVRGETGTVDSAVRQLQKTVEIEEVVALEAHAGGALRAAG